MRGPDDDRYRPALPLESEELTLDSMVVCATAPYLFCIRARWIPWGPHTARVDAELLRLDLSTGDFELWPIDEHDPRRRFVSSLAGAAADGSEVYAVCGYRTPEESVP